MGLCKKKTGIKDAYPKKVCHMLRHVQNKRCIPKEGCHMPTRHVKKREKKRREKDSPYPKKKKEQEGDDSYKGVHPPSTKNIFPHTCTSWSRFMTCLSFGSGFWFSKIWEASLLLYPPYLQLHQKEALGVGWKRKADYQSLGEVENTIERFETTILGEVRAMFSFTNKKL